MSTLIKTYFIIFVVEKKYIMIVYPNAKINLGLNILNKRNDGFHNISSVFFPVKSCYDILEVKESKSFCFTVTGKFKNNEDLEKNNICVRAFNLIKDNYCIPNVRIHLHKLIPIGAGLGGGSSDASFTLKALNDIFNLKISNSVLEKYSLKLGSDCPFFIENTTKYVKGIGETMYKFDLNLKDYNIELFDPGIHISTKQAYSLINPKFPKIELVDLIKKPIKNWKYNISNDFEIPIFDMYPLLAKKKKEFYERGAIYSSLTGSGSVVYAIFSK